MNHTSRRFIWLGLIGLLAAPGGVLGQTAWLGAPGTTQSWHTVTNWTAGVPNGFQIARVNNDGICEVSVTNAVAFNLEVGNTALGTATGEVRVIDQTLDLGFFLFVGFGNTVGQGEGRLLGTNATVDVDAVAIGQTLGASRGNGELRLTNSVVRTASFGVGNGVATAPGLSSASGVASLSGGLSKLTNAPAATVDILVGSATAGVGLTQAIGNGSFSFSGNRIGPLGQLSAGLAASNEDSASASATGSIHFFNTVVYPAQTADITLRVGVGVAEGDNTDTTAVGDFQATSSTFQEIEEVVVGGSTGTGGTFSVSSVGTLGLNNSTLNAGSVLVGGITTVTSLVAIVSAYGCLELTDSTVTVQDFMAVGTFFPLDTPSLGSPSGKVELVRSSIDVANSFTAGSNTVLRFQIDGPTRGTQYGALDAGTALIEGDIEFVFTSPPTAGTIYRLIMVDATGTLDCVESKIKIIGADPNTLLWSKGVDASGQHVLWTGIPNPPHIRTIDVVNDTNVVLTIDGLVPNLDYRIQRRVDPAVDLWPEIANPVTLGSSHTTTTTVENTPPVPALRIFYP